MVDIRWTSQILVTTIAAPQYVLECGEVRGGVVLEDSIIAIIITIIKQVGKTLEVDKKKE